MASILLVEDDPDIRDLMQTFLQLEGHTVATACDAAEADIALHRVLPDLILMDLSLPGGVDGFEVTRRLRADPRFAAIPVIALTAHAMAEHRERALAAGCDAHWTKPIVDLRAFGEALRDAVAKGRPSVHRLPD